MLGDDADAGWYSSMDGWGEVVMMAFRWRMRRLDGATLKHGPGPSGT